LSTQSEAILEENLLKQLEELQYERVVIKDDKALEENLKIQLEKHNKIDISDTEFKRVLNHLNKGNVFEKAKILRDKFNLQRDDGTTKYIEFLDSEHWCQNLFQVTSQVTVEGKYTNRYDVTILINGLPLVQIELKRRGGELKEAFNQINRYQKHSYNANNALFRYAQIFVISNGVNTKYYSNNERQSFEQTFFWADKENKNITNLDEFTNTFLQRCHISKMICKYIVLAQEKKILMVLRPYQFYAVEAIIDKVNNSNDNGYIWHTTGSGKTLTSFKASQILMKLPKVEKIVFVVDRKDLDYQTTKEFNSFSDGSVDGTNNTTALVKQLSNDTPLVVTTIQKLNTAIKKTRYLESMKNIKDKHIVFIFDECHRSQFGDTHKAIVKFFTNHQMIGFTGTPILEKNATGLQTTETLFGKPLHKYVITDAIADKNVLKFSIEYIGRYKEKEGQQSYIDTDVEDIDIKELEDSTQRIEKIVDFIIKNHDRKTHSREFTAMMCVSSVDTLIKYYDIFKKRKLENKHNLKIATIFSYGANEESKDANSCEDGNSDEPLTPHTREKLEQYVEDYNVMFGSKETIKDTQGFYNYYNNISKRVKEKEIDILLVVNMFLTGFDSPKLNTLYVDKNLKYHGLIQAFSRTNRLLNERKSQGNIVCFRKLKPSTDEAIQLFSNKEAIGIITMEPYEEYVVKFDAIYEKLIALVPTYDDVNELRNQGEEYLLEFVQIFREIMRAKNILECFADFKWSDLKMGEQEFNEYLSKYLDIKPEKTTNDKEKTSILEDVDFELELIHKDEINVSYILQLLGELKDEKDEEKVKKQKENISNILNNNPQLRSKKELIEQFINDNLLTIKNSDEIEEEFEKFWDLQKEKAFELLCEEENLFNDEVKKVIDTYLYEQRKPLSTDVAKTLKTKHGLLKRKKIVSRVLEKIIDFVDTFFEGEFNTTKKINNTTYEGSSESLLVADLSQPYGKN